MWSPAPGTKTGVSAAPVLPEAGHQEEYRILPPYWMASARALPESEVPKLHIDDMDTLLYAPLDTLDNIGCHTFSS